MDGFAAASALQAGPGNKAQVKPRHAVLRVSEPPGIGGKMQDQRSPSGWR